MSLGMAMPKMLEFRGKWHGHAMVLVCGMLVVWACHDAWLASVHGVLHVGVLVG